MTAKAVDARSTRFSIRVSRAEKQRVLEKATAAGLSVSAYLRVATDRYADQLAFRKLVSELADRDLKPSADLNGLPLEG